MDAGLSLVLALIAFVSLGLIYFRVRDAASDLWRAYGPREPSIVSEDTAPEITSSREDRPLDTSTDTSTIPDNARAPYPYLTERAIVSWLAALKMADSYRYSANKIYTLVGGNRNDVMAWVRSVRGDEPPAAPAITPIAGRPYDPRAYADDPALAYEEPPR